MFCMGLEYNSRVDDIDTTVAISFCKYIGPIGTIPPSYVNDGLSFIAVVKHQGPLLPTWFDWDGGLRKK